MLKDVLRSGVAFTRDPSSGGHYHVVIMTNSGSPLRLRMVLQGN